MNLIIVKNCHEVKLNAKFKKDNKDFGNKETQLK